MSGFIDNNLPAFLLHTLIHLGFERVSGFGQDFFTLTNGFLAPGNIQVFLGKTPCVILARGVWIQ